MMQMSNICNRMMIQNRGHGGDKVTKFLKLCYMSCRCAYGGYLIVRYISFFILILLAMFGNPIIYVLCNKASEY